MAQYLKAFTPILVVFLSLFISGQALADNKVVVVPMFGPDAEIIYGHEIWSPSTVAAQQTHFSEAITSERAGYWMVNKNIARLSVSCTVGDGVVFYLQVDDVPIRSSMQYKADGILENQTFSGISKDIISPGQHSLEIGAQCVNVSGTASGWSTSNAGWSYIVVIPR